MKKALTPEELAVYPVEFQNRVATIKADKLATKNDLMVNDKVLNTNIHELFVTYDGAFFNGDLEGKVLLEWSKRMTQCAGICYLDQASRKSGK